MENLACRETIFDPGVTDDQLRASSQLASQLTHTWPGFQLVLLMNGGPCGRGVSFWQNQQTLDNYIHRHQDDMHNHVASHEPANPWLTSITSRRTGIVDMYLTDASMPAANREVVSWYPPGAVRISEIHHLEDLETLRNWWPMIARPTAPLSLVQVNGFQFFAAVLYPDNVYVTYLGFRSQSDLDAYLESDLHSAHNGPFKSTEFRANLEIVTFTGQLLAWFMRDVETAGFG
jgi:hypothetical protein